MTTDFSSLNLREEITQAITELGYSEPTPIQAGMIPLMLTGVDVIGQAQTGTGKTAAFALPILNNFQHQKNPQALVLAPTRELALQVAENFVQYGKYLKLTHALIIGGESMADQKDILMRGVDVLIATPGRLLDLFERGGLLLGHGRLVLLDPAVPQHDEREGENQKEDEAALIHRNRSVSGQGTGSYPPGLKG